MVDKQKVKGSETNPTPVTQHTNQKVLVKLHHQRLDCHRCSLFLSEKNRKQLALLTLKIWSLKKKKLTPNEMYRINNT